MTGRDRDKRPFLQGDDLPSEDAIPAGSYAAGPGEDADDAERWDDGAADDLPPREPGFGAGRLALDDGDRLPWLESPDDIGDGDGVDSGRIVGFVLLGLVALALVVGAVWYASNRAAGPGPADGSLIRAEQGPYKVAPDDPEGKTFAGTGDTSFAVSEGETRGAKLAGSDAAPPSAPASAPKPKPSAAPSAKPSPAASAAPTGVGVQVGAYMSPAQAEAGWATLVQRNSALSGLKHRVVEGRADIGTVYRLQAVAADLAAANALCATLKAAGQGCQVKR